jgi:hypothetical protein
MKCGRDFDIETECRPVAGGYLALHPPDSGWLGAIPRNRKQNVSH